MANNDKDKTYFTDNADWAEELKDVKPLKGRDQKIKNVRKSSSDFDVDSFDDLPPPRRKMESFDEVFQVEDEISHRAVPTVPPVCKDPFVNHVQTSGLFRAERAGIDHKIMKKLSKGEIPFEHRLDLHGYREEEAWAGLTSFLHECYSHSMRCVLVIHGKGKGYGEKGDMGIIKSQICAWLEGSNAVLAYHTCQPKHGGSGAVYVLLRKNKSHQDI